MTQQPNNPTPNGVTARAVGLSLVLVVAMCWWIAYSEVRTGTTELTCTALPIGVVFALFVVAIINNIFAARLNGREFAPSELAVIYVLTAVGSSVAGIGMIGFLTPAIANPLWFTTDDWKKFADAVPWSWAPRDPDAIRAYYLGQSTLYTWPHVRAWLPPLATWCGFLLLILVMTLCFAILLRKQWIENERLNFPITYVPIAMTVQPGGIGALLANPVFRAGFLIPVVLQCINNLHWLFPNIPEIPVKPVGGGPLDIGAKFTSPPWNALGYFPLAFHPNTIGLSYLLSADVSFSSWFFYLLRKSLDVLCVAAGLRGAGASSGSARMPYMPEQGVGAWICLALLTIWLARHHLADVFHQAFRAGQGVGDPARNNEAMSYRLALSGALASFAGAVAFACWGGLPLPASIVLMALFAAYVLALSRIRAEVGTAWHFGPYITAPEMTTRLFGPMNMGLGSLSVLAYHTWYNIDMRSLTTPHFFEAFRIAEAGNIQARRLTAAMMLALVVGLVCASWTVLHLYYTYGASTAHVNSWRIFMGKIPYQIAAGHLADRTHGPDIPGLEAVGFGAIVTLLLGLARARYIGWPFHPAGYAIGNTFITDLLWFPFFLGWLAKWLTLRFGGMRAYRRALPFFIGLILGDYVIASLWTLVGIALGIDMYRCFPN